MYISTFSGDIKKGVDVKNIALLAGINVELFGVSISCLGRQLGTTFILRMSLETSSKNSSPVPDFPYII